jgi:hypothetical protein
MGVSEGKDMRVAPLYWAKHMDGFPIDPGYALGGVRAFCFFSSEDWAWDFVKFKVGQYHQATGQEVILDTHEPATQSDWEVDHTADVGRLLTLCDKVARADGEKIEPEGLFITAPYDRFVIDPPTHLSDIPPLMTLEDMKDEIRRSAEEEISW